MQDTLPAEARTILDSLRKQDPATLTEANLEFLRARRSYLSEEEILNLGIAPSKSEQRRVAIQTANEEATAPEAGPAEKPTRKAKKA